MKAQRRIRSLAKIETFEDIVRAVKEGIFPCHLFKMVEACGEKSPYTFYRRIIRRGKGAFIFFNALYAVFMVVAATLIYQRRSIESTASGLGLMILVMLLVLSDVWPHFPTTKRCAEERFSNFVAFFKELYAKPETAERKLDADFLREQVALAKIRGVIPEGADMTSFIIQNSVLT